MFSEEQRRKIVARARAAIDTAQVLGADARGLCWGGVPPAHASAAPRGDTPQADGTMKVDNGACVLVARAARRSAIQSRAMAAVSVERATVTHQRARDLATPLSTRGGRSLTDQTHGVGVAGTARHAS